MGKRNIDPSIKAAYLDWLMTPHPERVPGSKQEFADENDVHIRTLYNWEHSTDFQEEMHKLKAIWGVRFHGDILGRLMKIVSEGQDQHAIPAAKVLLQHLRIPDVTEEEELDFEGSDALQERLKSMGYKLIDDEQD